MMARRSWFMFMCHGPANICRHHFYKILVFIVFALLAAQYGLNVFVYQFGGYFFFNTSSLSAVYSSSPSKDISVQPVAQLVVKTTPLNDIVVNNLPVVEKLKNQSLASLTTSNVSLSNNATNNAGWIPTTVLQTRGLVKNTSAGALTLNVSNASSNVAVPVVPKLNVSTVANVSGEPELPLCPLVPPKLVGAVKVWTEPPSMEELEKIHPELELGGRFHPKECKSRHRVAIVIPYRDRDVHLRMFLHNMHPILQRQQLDYGIYVIEQNANTKFNRAKLMNVGFAEALKQYDYQCFVFHDVDLLPEDDRNLYSCPEQPRHMSVAIDVFNYRLPYDSIFGGVSALTKKQFETINGFSNQFWGWGGEDDDMANRISYHGYHVSRYPVNIARYKMMKHKKDQPNPDRYNKLYKGKQRFKTDGINSLKYKRLDLLLKRLYTWVHVDLQQK